MFQLNSSLVIRFNFFFPFFTNYQREENAKDQRDVDKNVFFFFEGGISMRIRRRKE